MTQQIIFLGTAPGDGTGDSLRVGGGKINDNFTELYKAPLLASARTNYVYDNFDAADGTPLNGRTTTVGGKTWNVLAQGVPQIINGNVYGGGRFTATSSGTNLTVTNCVGRIVTDVEALSVTGFGSGGATLYGPGIASVIRVVSQTSGTAGGNGVYVTTADPGVTAQTLTAVANSYSEINYGENIKNIQATFRFDPTSYASKTSAAVGTLVAGKVKSVSIDWIAHCVVGDTYWELGKLIGGVFSVSATHYYPSVADGNFYSLSMAFDYATNTITVVGPDGVAVQVVDTDLSVIPPTYGYLQHYPVAGSYEMQWGSVSIGKELVSKVVAQGQGANTTALSRLYGTSLNQRHIYLPISIPSAAGGGGTGWYRIATGDASRIIGEFSISAKNQAGFYARLQFRADCIAFLPAGTALRQVEMWGAPIGGGIAMIDQVRLSTDDAAVVALDIHLLSAYEPTDIVIDAVGQFTPIDAPVVGATVLSGTAVTLTTVGFGLS